MKPPIVSKEVEFPILSIGHLANRWYHNKVVVLIQVTGCWCAVGHVLPLSLCCLVFALPLSTRCSSTAPLPSHILPVISITPFPSPVCPCQSPLLHLIPRPVSPHIYTFSSFVPWAVRFFCHVLLSFWFPDLSFSLPVHGTGILSVFIKSPFVLFWVQVCIWILSLVVPAAPPAPTLTQSVRLIDVFIKSDLKGKLTAIE